ncbi:MAG TPA: hypothetical protein PK812_00785 [Beijerinckiaceae bacterium]|nr:hypothetical protein [Beijerinckiaceae bacterium]
MPADDDLRPIACFEVVAASQHVSGLRHAVALPLVSGEAPAMPEVPATYPVIWLGNPEIRAAVRSVAGMEKGLPLHFLQSVAYFSRIEVDGTYALDLSWRPLPHRDPMRPKLEFVAIVADAAGKMVARMSSVLLVVPAVRGA